MVVKGTKKDFSACGLMTDRVQQRRIGGSDASTASVAESAMEESHQKSTSKEHYEGRGPRNVRSIEKREKSENDASNFEKSSLRKLLKACYDERIRVDVPFSASHSDVTTHIEHRVTTDGYYFFVVYNDVLHNLQDVHVVLDVLKPTYEYSNYTRSCLNKSRCIFPMSFISRDEVVVEIPIRNGIERDNNDRTSILVSSCQPRKFVYVLFAATVFVVILLFAFV
jgi:hypothetical protein